MYCKTFWKVAGCIISSRIEIFPRRKNICHQFLYHYESQDILIVMSICEIRQMYQILKTDYRKCQVQYITKTIFDVVSYDLLS
jgi:hypothetical protein